MSVSQEYINGSSYENEWPRLGRHEIITEEQIQVLRSQSIKMTIYISDSQPVDGDPLGVVDQISRVTNIYITDHNSNKIRRSNEIIYSSVSPQHEELH